MGTEVNPDGSGLRGDADADLIAIQESLLAEDPVGAEAVVLEQGDSQVAMGQSEDDSEIQAGPAETPTHNPGTDQLVLPGVEVQATRSETVSEAPTVAGFGTGRVPLRGILWPFLIYDLVWAGFAIVLARALLDEPAGMAAYEWPYYEYALWIGIALTALGPLLILVVWPVTRARNRESSGVGISTLVIGSAATLLGVVLWWAALIVVDYLRLGSVY